MKKENYSVTYLVDKSPTELFNAILDVGEWWSGLYGEEFDGTSKKIDDEFSFRAGDGAHYSKQKLVALIPGEKIVWLVTDSNLSFLETPDEWTGTSICFDISKQGNKTKVTFTHVGLVPKIECYDACSGAWGHYLEKFFSPIMVK